MALVYDKISDATDGDLAIPVRPAYWGPLYMNSPSGNFVGGISTESNTSTAYLARTDVAPPEFVWKGDLYLGEVPTLLIATYATPLAVDDEGSMWCDAANLDGRLLEIPAHSPTPRIAYTWTEDDGKQHGLQATQLYTFQTSTGLIKLVMVAGGTVGHDNSLAFLGTKGVAGLTDFDTGGGWFVQFAFMDDNDDIWLAGAPTYPTDQLYLWRITDVADSAYDDLITLTMPAQSRKPVGYFSGGYFVGAWGDITANYYFRVNLTDGTLETRDISATPVNLQGESGGYAAVPSSPDRFFFWLASDSDERTMIQLLPDLTDGDTWNLDDWNAGDGLQAGDDGSGGSIVKSPVYLDGFPAFAGVRNYTTDDPDDLNADLFLYYFAGDGSDGDGDGDGLTDSSVTIRCWPYSLDGHDYAVFRLGPSETLVYDLTTNAWAHWASPGRENWRAHIGQNWVGMGQETLSRGFGTDVVAGDDASGTLWILDPTYGRDDRATTESDYFTRIVTGGVSLTGRDVVPCGALQLDYSTGNPSQTGATFTLETSDDWGNTFDSQGTVTITADDDAFCGVEWRGLGQARAPGRVFRITDNGAAFRLSGADLR